MELKTKMLFSNQVIGIPYLRKVTNFIKSSYYLFDKKRYINLLLILLMKSLRFPLFTVSPWIYPMVFLNSAEVVK
jgi:hypothetical protein